MFQVTFSDQALAELGKLPTLEQMVVIEPLSGLNDSQLRAPEEPLGSFSREGRLLFRLRSGEYRIYFERIGDTLRITCILHKNTLADFIYRTKLPFSEERMAEQSASFWEYIESLNL